MSNPHHAELLSLKGADAIAFAHAQFSSNVLALETGHWQFSAWLDPQGRVRNFFHLARVSDDRLLLLLRGGPANELADALKRFVFRSKVTLVALAPRALRTTPPMSMGTISGADDAPHFGCGTHGLQVTDLDAADDAWRLLQLRAGWAWIPDALLNTLLSSSLALQTLQAVMIDKGCYPGQEIVARMHFRSGYKKHLCHVELSHAEIAGEILRTNEQENGRLIDVVDNGQSFEALAVLTDDFAASATNEKLPPTDHGLIMRILETWPA